MKNKRLVAGGTGFIVLTALLGSFFLGGCAKNPPTAGSVHKTITTVIADAGTIAITAKQQYQAGTLPQTDTVRVAINDLGNAYNQARQTWLQVLSAEKAFQDAQQAQLIACSPSSTRGLQVQTPNPETIPNALAACQAATATANADKVALDAANTSLSSSVNVLVTKTSSVKALTAK